MKKCLFSALLVLSVASLGFLMYGCGGGTTTETATTTTTTVTLSSAQVDAAKTGVLLANGGSSMGVSAAAVGTAAGTNIKTSSVRSFNGAPPSGFFTENLLTSPDGYMRVTTEAAGGNMTPYLKLYTVGSDAIYGTFLNGKMIAKFITVEVQTLFSSGPDTAPPGITEEVSYYISRYLTAYHALGDNHPFTDGTIFRQINTMADYLAWAFMFPSMEAGVNSHMPPGPYIYFVTPEVIASNKIGAMECKMVFSKNITGEVKVLISTEPEGKPVAGSYSGSGKLTTPRGTLEATITLTHSTSGPPTAVTIIGTTESTPAYTVLVYMNPATGTATGEVRDSSGTKIGTLEGSAAGGKVYIGSTSETFTF